MTAVFLFLITIWVCNKCEILKNENIAESTADEPKGLLLESTSLSMSPQSSCLKTLLILFLHLWTKWFIQFLILTNRLRLEILELLYCPCNGAVRHGAPVGSIQFCCQTTHAATNTNRMWLWPGSHELRPSNYCSNSESYYEIFSTTTLDYWKNYHDSAGVTRAQYELQGLLWFGGADSIINNDDNGLSEHLSW